MKNMLYSPPPPPLSPPSQYKKPLLLGNHDRINPSLPLPSPLPITNQPIPPPRIHIPYQTPPSSSPPQSSLATIIGPISLTVPLFFSTPPETLHTTTQKRFQNLRKRRYSFPAFLTHPPKIPKLSSPLQFYPLNPPFPQNQKKKIHKTFSLSFIKKTNKITTQKSSPPLFSPFFFFQKSPKHRTQPAETFTELFFLRPPYCIRGGRGRFSPKLRRPGASTPGGEHTPSSNWESRSQGGGGAGGWCFRVDGAERVAAVTDNAPRMCQALNSCMPYRA